MNYLLLSSLLLVAITASWTVSAVRVTDHTAMANVTLNPMPSVTTAQYDGARANPSRLYSALQLTKANTYNYELWDSTGQDYLELVKFLNFTASVEPRMYVWVTLIPPTETNLTGDGGCSVPADSPLTKFNETSYFNQSMGPKGCNDYEAWGYVLGLLGAQFPQLVAVNIDDFTSNVGDTFHAQYLATIRTNLNSGGVRLWPTFYYHEYSTMHQNVLKTLPWLVGATDGILFYFRNDKAGPQQCNADSSCNPLATCVNNCLYRNCSNVSLPNFPGELADFHQNVQPFNTPIIVGIYFSEYHSCPGGPSVYYDDTLLKDTLASPQAVGAMVYTAQFFPDEKADCSPNSDGMPESKACAVLKNFE